MHDYPYISATDARNNFSETFNNTIYVKPQIIKKSKNDVLLIKQEEVFRILDSMKISVVINKDEDGTYFTSNEVMPDIIGWGKTKDEAIDDFITFLDVYAHDYYNNYETYSKTERGRKDLPYIFKVMCASSFDSLRGMLICRDGKN